MQIVNRIKLQNTGLATKILVGTVGFIVVLGLVLVFFVKSALQNTLLEKLEKRGVLVARHVAHVSLNSFRSGRLDELDLIARDYLRSEHDIAYIYFLDSHGEIIAHTFDSRMPAFLKRENRPAPVSELITRRLESDQGAVLDIAVPLPGGSAGSAHLGFFEASIRTDVDEIVKAIIWIIVIVLAAGIGLAAVLSAAITRPVKELAEAAQAVERGDLSARVRAGAHDEIGILGRAFNSMIEARRTAEDELRKSEKKLRDIASSLGEGVLVMNTAGQLEFMNPEAEQLLGWTEAELRGRQVHDIIHCRKEDGTPMAAGDCPTMNVLKTGERAYSKDDVFIRKDGTSFPVAFISAPVVEEGMVVAVAVSFRNITRRKEYESEREQLLLAYREALVNIKTLKGLMPICSSCKKIRDDDGYWKHIEAYIHEHSDAEFSHGICPECARKLYPQYYDKDKDVP